MTTDAKPTVSAEIYDAAAAWSTRLTSGRPYDASALDAWLAQSPDHRYAFDRCQRALGLVDDVANQPVLQALRADALAYTPARRSWGWAGASAATAVVLASVVLAAGASSVGGAGATLASLTGAPPAKHFTTAPGQTLRVALEDGSVLDVAPRSRVSVRYARWRRDIKLEAGEAAFSVAKDAHRPFVVDAGERRVHALGTRFDVRREARGVEVVLEEGRVSIHEGLAPWRKGVVLAPGEGLAAQARGQAGVRKVDVEVMTAWREGRLIVHDEPLSSVVERINRYSATRVVPPEDARVGGLLISGVFDLKRPVGFFKAVEAAYGVKARQDRGQVRLTWSE